ncbi:hypothetical protein [Streptomyces silaceus]|uniref:hypothetical protein n=1 Tax=Streptomyces silaceus TaxID=545123 RepID=UPI0006EBA7FA|nr:hypothetical protein [Streptomyces silaceus]
MPWGRTRTFTWSSGRAGAAIASSTPAKPTSPVISAAASTLPSAILSGVRANSSGGYALHIVTVMSL